MNEFPRLPRDHLNNILKIDVDRSLFGALSAKSIHWEFLLRLKADLGRAAQYLLSDEMMEEGGTPPKLVTCF